MSLLKVSLIALVVLVAIISVSGELTKVGITGRTFTVKSADDRYGYLRRYGPYGPLDLLEFTWLRPAGRFRFLWNGAIQELSSGKCLNLISPTNLQIVLKSICYGSQVLKWDYIPWQQYLKDRGTGKCLSVWNYSDRPPPAVSWVPGLNECGLNNHMILSSSY